MRLKKLIEEKRVVLFDGAIGTELIRRGLDTRGDINLIGPEHIFAFHRDYAQLGVDILTTNTFVLNRINLESRGLDLDVREVNLAGAGLARKAAQSRQYVFGNLGPTGKMLSPYGEYSEEQFYANYLEQASALAEGGVDGFIIQTMSDLRESLCALKACKETVDLPAIATLSFSTLKNGGHTIMGNSVSEIAQALENNHADCVGANCGDLSPGDLAEIVNSYKKYTNLPVLVQPNAGKPRMEDGLMTYDMSPEVFAKGIIKCIENGASIVGGCCGTTLEHINTVKQLIRETK